MVKLMTTIELQELQLHSVKEDADKYANFKKRRIENLLNSILDKTKPNATYRSEPDVVQHSLYGDKVAVNGILDYLQLAYNHHYGVVFSPDIIMHTVLCNVAEEVKNKEHYFRDYFTKSSEKTLLTVHTTGNIAKAVESWSVQVNTHSHTDMIEWVKPFSESDGLATLSLKCSMLDMVSKYYDYAMFMCGIPKIQLSGSKQDWEDLKNRLSDIRSKLQHFNNYMNRVNECVDDLIDGNTSKLAGIMSVNRVGSGGQLKLDGWIKNLFYDNKPRMIQTFNPCVSGVDFKDFGSGEEFRIHSGIMCVEADDSNQMMHPSFGYIVQKF